MRILFVMGNFFLVFLLGTLLLYIAGKIPPNGAIGFRPVDDGCYGIHFENKEVYGVFREGKVRIELFNLEYYVSAKEGNKSPEGFCLGKNFWNKERREGIDKQKEATNNNEES